MKVLLLSFLLINIAVTIAVTENQVECKSLTAYFVGVFKNRFRPRYFYNLQFELKLDAIDSEKEIYVKASHWNESLSTSSDFDMDLYYDDGWKDPLCSNVKQGCSGPYSNTLSADFTLDLNAGTAHDSFHLLYFKQFSNSFVLDNSFGQCTSNQMSLDDAYTPNATSFKYCVCCGSYSPDLFLGCPENPWAQSGEVTTPNPWKFPTTDRQPTPPTYGYVPCAKQIVVAIDNAKLNNYVPQMKQLLIDKVFAGNWNHTERLGLLWYSNSLENYIPFDYFNDNVNGLSTVRDTISTVNPRGQKSSPSLGTALQSILNKYHKTSTYEEISSIVFTSQKIKQSIVDSVKDLANKLNSNGHRLTIIGLGDIDPEDRYVRQLTPHYTIWTNPSYNDLPNWEQFFWKEGYGCKGDPPLITTTPFSITTSRMPPPWDFTPCVQRIVVAIDNSKSNGYGSSQKTFLINHVFGGDSSDWNYLERLGIVWYSNSLEKYIPFNTFAENDLNNVRATINSVNPSKKRTTQSIGVALRSILNEFSTNNNYQQMSTIVFTSQSITQQIVDANKDLATQLNTNGYRLTIIGLGDHVDPEGKYLDKLTKNNYIWIDPLQDPIMPDWNNFFWKTAYGCSGDAPPDPATPGSVGTITFPQTTTSLKPAPTPCAGHLLLMLDTSNALSDDAFNNQRTFVGGQLFSKSTTFFGDYSRLALGQCSKFSKVELPFDGGISGPGDVSDYVNGIAKSTNSNAQLDVCLDAIATQQINSGYTDTVTVAIHVSYLDPTRKQSAIDNANTLKAQGISLVLIVHGGSVSMNDLIDIAGPGGLVIKWPVNDLTPPKPKEWLKTLLGCYD